MQPKLLRVLEEKCFERVGGNKLIRSDFRLIAATNQDLEGLIARGHFRRDLYYRLNVISLHIPPLRERPEDVLALALHLLAKLARRNGCAPVRISPAAALALAGHSWQGNVRELSNVLERALLARQGDEIQIADLPFVSVDRRLPSVAAEIVPIRTTRAEAEKGALVAALRQTGNNKARAAALLGIHRTLLYKKMKKHGLPLGGQA